MPGSDLVHRLPLRLLAPLVFAGMLAAGAPARAQTPFAEGVRPEEIVPIGFTVARVGTTELTSIQRDGVVYLPLGGMFNFLRIRNDYDRTARRINGFFITRDTLYTVDLAARRVEIGPRLESIADNEYVIADGDVFFRPDFYQRVFGLPVEYSERRVAAKLKTTLQLPVFAERRRDRLEARLRTEDWSREADFNLGKRHAVLDGFRMDWAVSQNLAAERNPFRIVTTRIGTHVLGGDLLSSLNARFSTTSDLYYSRHTWRYLVDEQGPVRGVTVGDMVSQGLYMREYYGASVTNVPFYRRVAFADEIIPPLTLENRPSYLFTGGQLAGVSRPDPAAPGDTAGGFTLPLRYGSNLAEVSAYDVWGEERRNEYRIIVPQNMVPPGEVDYTLTAGRFRDPLHPYFASVATAWGTSRYATLGGRVEYFGHRDLTSSIYPSLVGLFRPFHSVAAEATFAPGAYTRGVLTTEFPWLLNLSAILTKYNGRNRLFNPRRADYDFDMIASMPFSLGTIRSGVAAGFTQAVLPTARERQLRASLDMNIGFFSPRFSFITAWNRNYASGRTNTLVRQSLLALRFRPSGPAFVSLSSTYDHLQAQFENLRAFLFISPVRDLRTEFSYERNFLVDASIFRIDVRYFFPFMRVDLAAVRSRGRTSWLQRASGFVGFASPTSTFITDNRSRTPFGSALVRPFVDLNDNGVRDDDEPTAEASGMTWRAEEIRTGGKVRSEGELGMGIINAVAYRGYVLEYARDAFENPLWVTPYRSYRLIAEPGSYRTVDIPLKVGGVVRGRVLAAETGAAERTSVQGVRVILRSTAWRQEIPADQPLPFEATVQTFTDGTFEFAAVPPGEYDVTLVPSDLARAGLAAEAQRLPASVVSRPEGSVVEGLEFVVQRVY